MARNKRLTKEEIQEDKFIEGLLKVYAFLKANLQTIIVAAVVILVAVAGYAAYYQNQESRRAEATLALRQATEAYQKAEESLLDAEKLAESEALLQTAQTELKAVFEKYANTTFADRARYQYANTLYYQGNYPEARTQFQQLIEGHQPENQMDSLYAQKAIGYTYEQEGDYEKAVAAYQAKAFPPTPQLSPEIRKFVLLEAKFNQALAYEKLGDLETARNTYKEIVDEFRGTLDAGLGEKSRELLEDAKMVIASIDEPIDVSNAKKLEDEKQYLEAYVAYADAIRTYKVDKDIQGGLSLELRKQISGFEKGATTVINSIQNARRAESEGRESSALYSYDTVVELETLGLSRRLYENALFQYKRLGSAQ
ncbi:MAG: tetratricopeptide repeat protein [Candidatus Poribacteria bacterium]|nr:tetratricopeptide repeat protein [Candidatus Poribacteria bacterium]